jgi:pyrroloquinoline quinone (PQQ) biosynthesis protein C
VHAEYDDTHPWEALEIIATILGTEPPRREVALVRSRIQKSYDYMRMTLDDCLAEEETTIRPAAPLEPLAVT